MLYNAKVPACQPKGGIFFRLFFGEPGLLYEYYSALPWYHLRFPALACPFRSENAIQSGHIL